MRFLEPFMPTGQVGRLHHVGFVVNSSKRLQSASQSQSVRPETEKLSVILATDQSPAYRMPRSSSMSVELIEPAGTNSPVEQFLQRG